MGFLDKLKQAIMGVKEKADDTKDAGARAHRSVDDSAERSKRSADKSAEGVKRAGDKAENAVDDADAASDESKKE